MANELWTLIGEDFLSFTLENHDKDFSSAKYFPKNKKIKIQKIEAHLLSNGLLYLHPDGYKKSNFLILSCGVHGNETAPMELLKQWTQDIFSGKIKLQIPLLLIIGNPPAIVVSKRFIEENLNRLFTENLPTDAENPEQLRAVEIMNHCLALKQQHGFKNIIHFDLHTAIRQSKHKKFLALPYCIDDNSNQLIQFWSDCGLTAALRSVGPASTFSYFSQSQLNAISATVELGKVEAFGNNDLTELADVDSGIRQFLSLGDWPKSKQRELLKLFQVKKELLKTSDAFQLNIADDCANFSNFEKGFILAEDKINNYQYKITSAEDVLIFPNPNVPVGQRAGLVAELVNNKQSQAKQPEIK